MATKKTTVEKTPIEKALEVVEVAEVKETVEKKAPAKKTAAKKTTTKKAETTEKKAPAKKASAKKAAEVKTAMTVQFDGKSYSQEDLMNIAKDVWQYDLQKDPAELKEVELYIKPEEHAAYYVFNGTEQGSFFI